MGDFDAASFPLIRHGNQFQDFEQGQTWVHHWGRTITEADNVTFSSATCHWNPLYINSEYARALGHPGMVVNPMLVLCTAVGMSVEDLSEAGGPFLGVEDCRFLAPVYPGDTITAHSEVLEKRESTSRPTSGIVTWQTTVANQRGEVVLTYRRTNLVARRREA